MRFNIYSKYNCVADCTRKAVGAIGHGTKPDGTFRMHYFCEPHYKAADEMKKKEFEAECKRKGWVELGYGHWGTKNTLLEGEVALSGN